MEQVWQLLINNGINEVSLELIKHSYVILIMIPIVTTILALLRYVIGIKSPNLVSVLLLTFAFLEISFNPSELSEDFISGLKYGTLLYVIVLITALGSYALIKKLRMHYIPKMSIVFTIISLVFITFMVITQLSDTASLLVNQAFILVIIATLAENIVTSFAVKNFKYSLDMGIRTYLVALLSFVIIANPEVRKILTDYPYLLIVIILMNLYIGRFKGLRFSEYFRFRSILLSENTDNEQTESNTKK